MAASFDKSQLSKFKNAPPQLKKLMNHTGMTQTENFTYTISAPQDICCQPKEGDQPQPETPVPAPVPAPAPNPQPEPPPENKSIFSRVAAVLKEKSTLVDMIAKHEAELKDKTDRLNVADAAVASANARLAAYESAEKELREALEQSQKANKSAEDRAIDIVAAQGFPQDKLPAQTDANKPAPKTGKEWLDEYNAITDPAERTIFFRQNKAAILKANEDLKKSEKK